MALFACLLALLLVVVCLKYRKRLTQLVTRRLHLYKCLSRLPGPPAWPILGSAPYFKRNDAKLSHQLEDWCTSYGGREGVFIIWLGPVPIVVLTKAHSVQAMLTSAQVTPKPYVYQIMRAFLGDGLITSHGEKWKTRRRMLTPAFHQTILTDFMQIYNEQAQILIDRQLEPLFGGAGDDRRVTATFDLDPIIRRCALDVICATSMGTSVHAQQATQNHYCHSLIRKRRTELTQLAAERGCSIAQLKGDRKAIPAIDILLKNNAENRLGEEAIREEIDTLVTAGHETTSLSVCWTLFHLAHSPDYQRRLYDEIYARFGNDRRDVSIDDLRDMPYLDKCYKEALRLTPPAGVLGRMLTEPLTVGQYTLPAETTVFVVPMMVHQDPDQYPDPYRYDPERFSAEAVEERHPYAYIPFSAGVRNCIGQKFATLEAKTILIRLLRLYHVETMMTFDEARPMPGILMRPADGFPVRLHRRSPMPAMPAEASQ